MASAYELGALYEGARDELTQYDALLEEVRREEGQSHIHRKYAHFDWDAANARHAELTAEVEASRRAWWSERTTRIARLMTRYANEMAVVQDAKYQGLTGQRDILIDQAYDVFISTTLVVAAPGVSVGGGPGRHGAPEVVNAVLAQQREKNQGIELSTHDMAGLTGYTKNYVNRLVRERRQEIDGEWLAYLDQAGRPRGVRT